jgi:hypothetical protein
MLKANAIVWLINIIILALFFIYGVSTASLLQTGYFSKMLLLETGITFLIAGATAFSGSILTSKMREQFLHSTDKFSVEKLRDNENKANLFIIMGILLFLQSLIASL